MRVSIAFLCLLLAGCNGMAFYGPGQYLFGLRGGGMEEDALSLPYNYEMRAELALVEAIEKVEEKVKQAVEKEVETLFHDMPDHHHQQQQHHNRKAEVSQTAQAVVERGVKKIKSKVNEHDFKGKKLPFVEEQEHAEHEDINHRMIHAIESAERAVLHAVEEEVNVLFPPDFHHEQHPHEEAAEHHHHETKTKVKAAVQEGVKKTSESLREETRDFLQQYLASENFGIE